MHRHPLRFFLRGKAKISYIILVCVGTLIFFLGVQILLTSSIGGSIH